MEELTTNQATVNITYNGQAGDLSFAVDRDSSNDDVKRWATEALLAGDVPGITVSGPVNLNDFVVERFAPTEQRGHLIMIRPKTEFGA